MAVPRPLNASPSRLEHFFTSCPSDTPSSSYPFPAPAPAPEPTRSPGNRSRLLVWDVHTKLRALGVPSPMGCPCVEPFPADRAGAHPPHACACFWSPRLCLQVSTPESMLAPLHVSPLCPWRRTRLAPSRTRLLRAQPRTHNSAWGPHGGSAGLRPFLGAANVLSRAALGLHPLSQNT